MGNLSPAQYVIKTFGGVRTVARAIGRASSSVCKWQRPISEKGTGGKIPSRAQELILTAAKERGLDITPTDLIYGRKA